MAKIICDAIELGSFIVCNLHPIRLNILYLHLVSIFTADVGVLAVRRTEDNSASLLVRFPVEKRKVRR